MPYSVYIAKPPKGGGYGPHIHKVGKTTEANVESRVAALNDAGSNYPTANSENWELVDHFEFADAAQMDAFESAMAAHLEAGVDPHETGATELFESAALDADVHHAALAAVKTLVERDLVDIAALADLVPEQGFAAITSAEQRHAYAAGLPDEAVEEIANLVLELLSIGIPVLGIGLLLWRGKRIYGALKGQWDHRIDHWKSVAPPRPTEPGDVAEADEAFRRASAAAELRRKSN